MFNNFMVIGPNMSVQSVCENEHDVMTVLCNFMNLAPRAAQTPASLH